MKYNSIGEQLIAKAKELDPSYKPDKFNDMSEAINIILNNSGSSVGSDGGKLEGFSIDVSDTYNPETKEFSGTLTDEQWAKVQNEQIYWIEVIYISNQDALASTNLRYLGPFLGEGRAFGDNDGSVMVIYNKSVEGMFIKAALTIDTQSTPTSQLIPSITTSNEQQNLTIGNGLEIKDGALDIKSNVVKINTYSININKTEISTTDSTDTLSFAESAKTKNTALFNLLAQNENNILNIKVKLNLVDGTSFLIFMDYHKASSINFENIQGIVLKGTGAIDTHIFCVDDYRSNQNLQEYYTYLSSVDVVVNYY